MIRKTATAVSAALVLFLVTEAGAGTIDFDDLEHGRIVNTQYLGSHGVTISADNEWRTFDLAIAFDTQADGTTDWDLEGPPLRNWTGGNLAPTQTQLGKILIISENDGDSNNDGILNRPDDEGGRPAGRLIIEFATPINAFGWDMVDIESVETTGAWFGAFYLGNTALATVPFVNFVTNNNIFYDPTIVFGGDNTANRISPITANDLTAFTGTPIQEFDRVEIRLGGSGGIDNLTFGAPLPSSAWAGLALLVCLGLATRFRRAG